MIVDMIDNLSSVPFSYDFFTIPSQVTPSTRIGS